jgi:hypothetical protein
MFGFDGSLEAFTWLMDEIADNKDGCKFSHKKVRAYARCLLALAPWLDCGDFRQKQIALLLASMSVKGLPHYDRSFLAAELSKILHKAIEESNSKRDEYGDSIDSIF